MVHPPIILCEWNPAERPENNITNFIIAEKRPAVNRRPVMIHGKIVFF